MKRTLVTGGSGFLGSHIADTLTSSGHQVVIFDSRPSPYLRDGQEMVVGSVTDPDALNEAAAGCNLVFHLAALADLNTARDKPLEAAHVNILGTVLALEAARQAGVERFLFASSVYVYSRAGGFYRCSKQACESYIEEYQQQFDLPYTILRYGSLYGPRSGASNGVYRLLEAAARQGSVRHVGTAQDSREYIHVEDAARLSVESLAESYENQHLVITGQHPVRLADLFTMFSEILGREIDVEYVEAPAPGRDEHYRMTPYAYNPTVGRKLTSNYYVDMGQGVLQLLDEMQRKEIRENGSDRAFGLPV